MHLGGTRRLVPLTRVRKLSQSGFRSIFSGSSGPEAEACQLLLVPSPWYLAVHHQSLAFRARLYHAKSQAPEEEAAREA